MARALLFVAALAACGGPTPIRFAEVTGSRAPRLAQDRFVPNDGFNSGLGAAVGDVDGDGRPDLYLASGGLYLDRADPAGFRLEPAPFPGPPPDATWLGAAFGDYDRDGDLDLAVCGQGGTRLWRNDGAGGFTDVTAAAGVGGAADDVSLSVAWGDLDGDGWLDLAIANYGYPKMTNDEQPSRLYLNRRDGSFTALTAPLADHHVRAWIVTLADFDGDGRLDLHLGDDAVIAFLDTAKPRHDRVFLNRGLDANGQLTLVESSAQLGLDSPHATMCCAFGNADRGAGWDVFIADIHAGWLYRGAPFRDVTAASGIDLSGPSDQAWWQWGSAFADLDGDGFEDALVAQSEVFLNQDGADQIGPLLLRNHAGKFSLERYAFGGPMNARAIALADLDGDGDQDAIVAPFFDRFRFFENRTGARHFLRVALSPTVSAPGAAGAVVSAVAGGVTQKRMRVAGGQPHSSSEEILDFGLGDATQADVTVQWPSGAIQKIAHASGAIVVSEPAWLTVAPGKLAADATAAGLGGCTQAHLAAGTLALDATCDAAGVARFDLPAGPLRATLTIDGHELPAHPAIP